MPWIFWDKTGQILGREWSKNIDLNEHRKNHGYPEDCIIEEVTEEQLIKSREQKLRVNPYLEPYERNINCLIEVLEDHLKLQKGSLKTMIEAKLGNHPTD